MADVYIYEDVCRCSLCENGVETHNCYHSPYVKFSFSFNQPNEEFDMAEYSSHTLVEEWEISSLRGMMESPPEMGDCGVYNLSWTQLAIARCNELMR